MLPNILTQIGLDYRHISSTIFQIPESERDAKLKFAIKMLQEIEEEIDDFQDRLNELDLNYELPESIVQQTQLLQEVLEKMNITNNTKQIIMHYWNKNESNTLDNLYSAIERFTKIYWENFEAVYNMQSKISNTNIIEKKYLCSRVPDEEDTRKNIKINFKGKYSQLAQLIKHLQLLNFLEQEIYRKDLAKIVSSCFLVKGNDINYHQFHNTLDKAFSGDATRNPSKNMKRVIQEMKNLQMNSDNLTN